MMSRPRSTPPRARVRGTLNSCIRPWLALATLLTALAPGAGAQLAGVRLSTCHVASVGPDSTRTRCVALSPDSAMPSRLPEVYATDSLVVALERTSANGARPLPALSLRVRALSEGGTVLTPWRSTTLRTSVEGSTWVWAVELHALADAPYGVVVQFSALAASGDSIHYYGRRGKRVRLSVCILNAEQTLCADKNDQIPSDTVAKVSEVREDAFLGAWFREGENRLSAHHVGLDSIRTRVNGDLVETRTVGASGVDPHSAPLSISNGRLVRAPHGALVELEFFSPSDVFRRVFVHTRRREAYGYPIGGDIGLWIPVGLFASNFNRGGSGTAIGFEPALVSLAAGRKWFRGRGLSDYLGASAIIGWQSVKDSSGSRTLDGVTFGLLGDYQDLVYGGIGYSARYRTGSSSPGWVALIGFGPRLLTILKSLRG